MKNRVLLSGLAALGIMFSGGARADHFDCGDVYSKICAVMHIIAHEYYKAITPEEMQTKAIEGLLRELDPHSGYIPNFAEFEKSFDESEFNGVGLDIVVQDGRVTVVAPMEGSPAAKAGVQTGDIIIGVRDEKTKARVLFDRITLDEAAEALRGESGTSVTLFIEREKEPETLEIKIERNVIKIRDVRPAMLESGIGYLRVHKFGDGTVAARSADFIEKWKGKEGGLKGVIIDLRGNPGGILDETVSFADNFLDGGAVVSVKDQHGGDLVYSADKGDILEGKPIVVLVNGGSASASEVFAGAMQDTRRGIIVGERTFGKGSVQTIAEFRDGSAVRLTSFVYATPKGHVVQGNGITPDIIVPNLSVASPKEEILVRESDLLDSIKGEPLKEEATQKTSSIIDSTKDFQLHAALNVLKGMIAAGGR
ncbi:S41 family peptidase [bacterium]|nr:S41 family peptidase [bacterium]MCI0679783.1 S41 family peptidase [bacterium]